MSIQSLLDPPKHRPQAIDVAVAELSCSICEHADQHFWWGPDHAGTHCRNCHRSWEGVREIHCVLCCAHFTTDSMLVLHKDGLRCLDPATVTDEDGNLLLRAREGAGGPTWCSAESQDRLWR